ARCGVDADLDEVRTESRLLIRLVEVAVFDRVLGDEAAVARGLGERHAAIARANLTVREHRVGGVEAELLRHRLAQLDARGIDTGGRVVGAPLSARAARDRKRRA